MRQRTRMEIETTRDKYIDLILDWLDANPVDLLDANPGWVSRAQIEVGLGLAYMGPTGASVYHDQKTYGPMTEALQWLRGRGWLETNGRKSNAMRYRLVGLEGGDE